MRALWIAERFPPQRGGVAISAERQVGALAPRLERLDVVHLTRDLQPGQVVSAPFEGAGGAVVHSVGRPAAEEEASRLLFETACALGRLHRSGIVHGFFAVPAGYVAMLVARSLGLPSVVSLRGNDVDRSLFHGPRLAFFERAVEGASAVAGVSNALLAEVRMLTGRSEGLWWIPNGVDSEFFSPGPPEPGELALLEKFPRPWVGFVGEARFKKGLPVLLELAERFAGRGVGTLFLVGGVRGDERESFERWRVDRPAAANRLVEVSWVRGRDRLRSFYRALDLLVLPSLWDGMPNALLEAMACGRPAVASAVGGVVDVVVPNECGWLVPFEELGRFGAEVDRVLALPPSERESVGLAGRQRVTADFPLEREIGETVELYRRLLAGGARQAGLDPA